MHKIAVLALPGFVPFDLAIPCALFAPVRTRHGRPAYSVRVCSQRAEVATTPFRLRANWRLDEVATADTVIVPGIEDVSMPVPLAVVDALHAAWTRGARLASICSGTFVLAATGLLNGRRATTHWIAAAELARRYPRIEVDPDVLFVDEGRIVTSAGLSAGLDMCLHLIRRDHGQEAAARAARLAVAPLDRDGGQSQFIHRAPPRTSASLAPLLDWIQEHLEAPLDVASLAARVKLSPRTFARRFRQQTGTTPMQWVLAAKTRRAQELLETTALPLDRLANAAGFDSAITFRTRFQRIVGVTPSTYRRRFNGKSERAAVD